MIGLLPALRNVCPLLMAVLLVCGCTLQRVEQDTARTLRWMRLTHGAEVHAPGRWQLPRQAAIEVVELTPAPNPAWITAAQQGVDSVFFPGGHGPHHAALQGTYRPRLRLLVSWPAPGQALHVALVQAHDGALLEAARLDVSSRWLSGRSSGAIRNAFRELAASFHGAR